MVRGPSSSHPGMMFSTIIGTASRHARRCLEPSGRGGTPSSLMSAPLSAHRYTDGSIEIRRMATQPAFSLRSPMSPSIRS
eukprot:9472605-Pyramimonas_sp.AAC.1